MDALTPPEANLKASSSSRKPKLEFETAVALLATGLIAAYLVLTMLNAGPLWRDETNSINVAQMRSLKELWSNMPFESFPALWLLLLRGWSFLGMADSDAGIRVLGLFMGLFFLAALWLCARWMGGRSPIVSLALLGSVPAFVFTVGSNRAYGLALCLLVLSFGTIWRMVEFPSRIRIISTFVINLLFLHCLYYDAVFLGAILFGAAVVVVRRRQWKTLMALVGIGALSGPTLLVYLPVLSKGAIYAPMTKVPFGLSVIWDKLGDALTARSVAQPAGRNGPEVWLWIFLALGATAVAILEQARRSREGRPQVPAPEADPTPVNPDLSLYSGLSMVCGTLGYLCLLLKLQFPTQPWYYIGMLTLCAISLDGVFSVGWPSLRPWGLLRIGLLALVTTWYGSSVWEEAHTRRSNVDIIAAILGEKAKEGDLIVVQFAWEGITFDRYYHGRARWTTIPPIDSHKVHRTDLVWDKLNGRDTMAPVLAQASDTLRNGKSVWLVGHVALVFPEQLPAPPPPPPLPRTRWYLGPYASYWGAQLGAHLLETAAESQTLTTSLNVPVNCYEDVPLLHFSGYRPQGQRRDR